MIAAASLGIVILGAFGQAYPLSKGEQAELIETPSDHKSDAKSARVIGIGSAVIVAIIAIPILVGLIVLLAVYYGIALDAVALALASLTPTVLLVLFASAGIIRSDEKRNQQLIREIKKNDLRSAGKQPTPRMSGSEPGACRNAGEEEGESIYETKHHPEDHLGTKGFNTMLNGRPRLGASSGGPQPI
jgi:hypothetical protein